MPFITDTVIEISAIDRLQVRSGLLPPGMAFDPSLAPLSEPSWVLDMDAFTVQAGFAFEPNALTAKLRTYAETCYSFFRFATTEAFQDAHCGGPAPIAGEMR